MSARDRLTDYSTNANGERRLLKGVVPSLYPPSTLLQIKKEHDYIPEQSGKRKFTRLSGNHNSAHSGNNSTANIAFFDFANSAAVGANSEVILNESLHTSQENLNGVTNETEIATMAEDLNYYKTKCEELTQKLIEIDEWTVDNVVKYLSVKFNNKQQHEFFKMQIYNSDKKINGRRYNSDQKSLSLAMYKQSPKKYRFLKKIFILPGKSTLGRHSAHLMFQSGIDRKLFAILKKKVEELPEIDKYSVISWDEVALKPHLDYNTTRDIIDGFVDLNDSRRPDFATHSLTFVVRGIHTPYKEPLAFFYSGGIKSFELSDLVNLTIGAAFDAGLKPIGSLCDQPSTCVAAVHNLIEPNRKRRTPDGKLLQYKVRGNNIIHVYDPPHLIKVLRNNLLTKDLMHFVDKPWEITDCKNLRSTQKPKYASWDHISELYNLDCRSTGRLLPKLTDEHLNPKKEKMKVSVASQIFSKTVGDVMLRCTKNKQLPENFADTAHVLLFFNNLFDAFYGGGTPQIESLKGSINDQSVHFAFWHHALSVLANMNFVDKQTKKVNKKSSVLKKIESTIRGYMEMTSICLNAGMSEVALRYTNQDGLENFFGCCKALCGTKPIATHFRSAYTTMILNNLIGPSSVGSNCEEDKFIALLINIDDMLLDYNERTEQIDDNLRGIDIQNEKEEDMLDKVVLDPLFGLGELNIEQTSSISPISKACSAVCRKLIQITNCSNCKISLQEPSVQLDKDELDFNLPSQTFATQFGNVFCSLNVVIPCFCSEKSVKKKVLSQIESINVNSIGCLEHCDEMAIKFKELTANYALKSFCNDINNILSGKVSIVPPSCNLIQTAAFIFREKRKRIGKYSDIFRE